MDENERTPEPPSTAPNLEVGPIAEYSTLDEEIRTHRAARRLFAAYAGPLTWGPWVEVAAHGGVVTYKIDYSAVGSTLVHGAVNYYSSNGWRTDVFRNSITITTGNAWAVVKVCFHGNPFGSAVNGSINP